MPDPVTHFPTVQVTQLTPTPFKFLAPNQVDVPLAPLVSAKLYTIDNAQKLKVRATLYINSENEIAPFVAQPTEIVTTNGNQLQVYFDYNKKEKVPASYFVWYVEFDYTSATVGNITSIMSFLEDLDPETSRGTVTTVGH